MDAEERFLRALEELGITEATLTGSEQRALDEQGYLVLPGMIDAAGLRWLRDAFEQASQAEGGGRGGTPHKGTRHVGLSGSAPVLQGIYGHPKLLAAAYRILRRPFRMTGVGGRDPLPGHGAQALHTDWSPRQRGEPFYHVNSIWALDDLTPENGATRVVPGSHRRFDPVPKSLASPESRHPDEVTVAAPAGSALIFNAHLWHSGTRNRSGGSRRTLVCSMVARDAQYYAGTEAGGMPEADAEQLSPALRCVLGLDDEWDQRPQ